MSDHRRRWHPLHQDQAPQMPQEQKQAGPGSSCHRTHSLKMIPCLGFQLQPVRIDINIISNEMKL